MEDVSWLSIRKLKFAMKIETWSAKRLPHTIDPIASIRRMRARSPYAQRRRAGDASAFISQLMDNNAVVRVTQIHSQDIA